HCTNLADRTVDAAVGIDKYVPAPQLVDDLVAGDQLSALLDEKNQQVHRLTLELYPLSIHGQLVAGDIKARFARLDLQRHGAASITLNFKRLNHLLLPQSVTQVTEK